MHILIVSKNRIPVHKYGGTERVIWDLGLLLHRLGHQVTYLVKPGSRCDFAQILTYDKHRDFLPQVLGAAQQCRADIVHFQSNPFASPQESLDWPLPYIMTAHGNAEPGTWFPRNTVFISRDHAARHQGETVVYNGLHWDSYGAVDLQAKRNRAHFLGNVYWPFKNLVGAIDVACKAKTPMDVMGGRRLQTKNGWRFTWQPQIRFHGMTGGAQKMKLLNQSCGMVFPVTWHEPFGLAIVESMYFGCPVFATPYGAIPELVPSECGTLSASSAELAEALQQWRQYDPKACHARARDNFNAHSMATSYVQIYSRVLDAGWLQAGFPASHAFELELPWA